MTDDDPAIVANGTISFGEVGTYLADEYSWVLERGDFFLDFSTEQLASALRGTGTARRTDGRSAAVVLADPEDADAAGAREHRDEQHRWTVPAVTQYRDWSAFSGAVLVGSAAAALANQFHTDLPTLPVSLSGTPITGGVYVVARALTELPDAEAQAFLQGVREQAAGAPVILIELVRDTEEAVHDHDAVLDLSLQVWFGHGLRTPSEIEDLCAAAGFTVDNPGGTVVGWDQQAFELTARSGAAAP